MPRNSRFLPTEIPFYEGLIRKTAAMCAPKVQEEYEDIVAIFRVKVWRALLAFDASRSSMPVERYVFSCVKNQEKDLLKRKRRLEDYVEDVPDVHSVAHDTVYDEVERELPVIPSTLTRVEREVIVRLYCDESQRDVARFLCMTRSEMERVMRSIRMKMADWKPSPPERALQATPVPAIAEL